MSCKHPSDGVLHWRLYASDESLLWCGRCGAICTAIETGPLAASASAAGAGYKTDWQLPNNPPHVTVSQSEHYATVVRRFDPNGAESYLCKCRESFEGREAFEQHLALFTLCDECKRVGNARCLHKANIVMKFGG